jgi:hypothetical protein
VKHPKRPSFVIFVIFLQKNDAKVNQDAYSHHSISMRPLRELNDGVWYEVRTAINRDYPLFQSRQTIALFAQVLGEVSQRFVFEIRGLNLENERLVFYIKPKDGFQLPQIMQWLKQTVCVRYNVLHGLKGHTGGDRYWSEIMEGEPPPNAEPWTGPVMGVEASEFSPEKAREEATSGVAADKGRPRLGKNEGEVCPVLRKPAETPRKSAAPPG